MRTILLLLLIHTSRLLAQTDSAGIDPLRIPPSEYRYNGDPRTSITGELPLQHTSIHPMTAAIAGTIYGGSLLGIHLYHVHAVWKEQMTFHVLEDGDYSLYADKLGHFWSTNLASYIGTETALGAGFDYESSIWIGGVMGLGVMTYIEIGDGFGRNFGFSPSDMASNTLGAAYYIGSYYWPALGSITPKYLWVDPSWIDQPDRPDATGFFDNYNGSTYWASLKVSDILPATQTVWPDWLCIAVGYGARDLGYSNRSGRFVVGLDYDLVRMLPDGGSFWNWLRQTINHLKFPGPAVEFGGPKGTRFVLLYPFGG